MCNISFTSMVLSSDGSHLTLTGTSDCQGVVVSIPPFSQSISVPVVGGSWTATFTGADIDLVKLRAECGKEVKVDAFCKDDEHCRVNSSIILQCGDTETGDCCSMICCMVFKILVLLGFGLTLLGAILMYCPGGICDPKAMDHIGYSLRIWGFILFVIGLLFWFVLCRPKKCDWIAFLWQAFILAGWLMIYAGFCPECFRMVYIGLALFVLGLLLYFWWLRTCDVNVCRRLSEWAGLFLIPMNILLGLEAILMNCASANRTGPYILLAVAILFELWLLAMLKKNKCLKC